jgi:hypothetical protein
VAATVSDEVLNAAYDARLKNSGVQLNTDGMTLQQQVEAKKKWYEDNYVNQTNAIVAPVEAKVSDEELNAAYDARLKYSGVQLNTDGMTLQQQLEVKKEWYELFHLNQSYDYSLEYFDIQIDTDGMSLEEQRTVKQEALENWYDYL